MNCSQWGLLIELLSGTADKGQEQDILHTTHTTSLWLGKRQFLGAYFCNKKLSRNYNF